MPKLFHAHSLVDFLTDWNPGRVLHGVPPIRSLLIIERNAIFVPAYRGSLKQRRRG